VLRVVPAATAKLASCQSLSRNRVANTAFLLPKGDCTIPDDRNLRGAQDRARINMGEDYEVRYWSQRFGVSEEELHEAVRIAGSSVDEVARHFEQRKHQRAH